jgi:L-aminopeptidase/D-esterase-like protein
MATGNKKLPQTTGFFSAAQAIGDIGHAAANCLSRAIITAILEAQSMTGMTAFCDLEDR